MSNAYVPTLRRMMQERPLVRGQVTMEYEALSAALAWHEAAEQLARAEATLTAIRAWAPHLRYQDETDALLALLDAKETP